MLRSTTIKLTAWRMFCLKHASIWYTGRLFHEKKYEHVYHKARGMQGQVKLGIVKNLIKSSEFWRCM